MSKEQEQELVEALERLKKQTKEMEKDLPKFYMHSFCNSQRSMFLRLTAFPPANHPLPFIQVDEDNWAHSSGYTVERIALHER